jgi:hypothetical protein
MKKLWAIRWYGSSPREDKILHKDNQFYFSWAMPSEILLFTSRDAAKQHIEAMPMPRGIHNNMRYVYPFPLAVLAD